MSAPPCDGETASNGEGEPSGTGGGAGDEETLPSKRKRSAQLRQKIVTGQAVCMRCSAPITGSTRRVFCEDKPDVLRCRQAFHSAKQHAAHQAATAAAGQAGFAEGLQHQAALQQQQQHDESGEVDAEEASVSSRKQRLASLGFEDTGICVQFNRTMLEDGHDGWQSTTFTLPISLKDEKDLLMPFLAVSLLGRSEDTLAHVLLPGSSTPWRTSFKNKTTGKTGAVGRQRHHQLRRLVGLRHRHQRPLVGLRDVHAARRAHRHQRRDRHGRYCTRVLYCISVRRSRQLTCFV